MHEWERARKEYEAIEIPTELTARVQMGIQRAEKSRQRAARRHVLFRTLEAVAACFIALFASLNLSPAFAEAAGDLPTIGGFFQVLTVQSWHEAGEDISYEVDVPGIQGGDDYTEQINQEIQARVDEKIAEGNQIIEGTKEAFLATGGTQEQWAERGYEVSVTYDVKYQDETTVSFVIDSYVSVASAYQEEFFYNLDLANDRELTLEDLLGSDWVNLCNQSIQEQIDDYPLSAGEQSPFFGTDMGGFTTVDDSSSFYINGKGNPVVVFPRASIAIGAMGTVEFEITK